eukprot:357286-Chlamydomonas_euryale.AAC.10
MPLPLPPLPLFPARLCRCTTRAPHAPPSRAAAPQRGGALVVRRLCGHMGAEAVLGELSRILDAEADLAFASSVVQARAAVWTCVCATMGAVGGFAARACAADVSCCGCTCCG